MLYVLLPLCVLAIGISFYRFMVVGNYVVTYEGECDPEAQACFLGYDADSQENYYYTKIHKYAQDVYAECGPDITDCTDASICLPEDESCTVTYCSPETILEGESCSSIEIAPEAADPVITSTSTEENLP